MFMKRKTRKPENAYAYRMLLSFKTSVTYIKKNLLHAESCVHCEAVFIVHDSIFLPGIVRCLIFTLVIIAQPYTTWLIPHTA